MSNNNKLEQTVADMAAERPFARMISASSLPGTVRKRLIVPREQVALIVAPDGSRMLAAGTHTVGSVWGWFNGRFSQTQIAILPAEPIGIMLNSTYLAGDGGLVEATVEIVCRIAPEPFYAYFLAAAGQTTWLELEVWLAQAADGVLKTAVSKYAAADLGETAVLQTISAALKAGLMGSGTAVGLAVESVRGLTIAPAVDLLERARQHEALQAELRRLEQDAAMDKLTNEAELRDFAHQLEADFGVTGLAALVVEEQGAGEQESGREGEVDSRLRGNDNFDENDSIDQISRASRRMAESRIAAELGRRWARLQGSDGDTGATIVSSEPGWLRFATPVRYLFSLVTLGLVFYSFLAMDGSDANYGREQIRVLLSAGGLMLGVVSTLWAETRARQKLLDQQVMGSLALLGRHDRGQADRFLRVQALDELEHLAGKLKESRFKLHRAGEKTPVVQLKEMELHVGRLQTELGRADTAEAVYLSGAKVTAVELAALYNYDESLLLQLNHIGDSAQTLLAGAMMAGDVAEAVPALAAELTEFEHRFRARSRFIRTPLADG